MYHGKNGDDDGNNDGDVDDDDGDNGGDGCNDDYNGYCGVGDDDESPSTRKTRDSKQCVSRFC